MPRAEKPRRGTFQIATRDGSPAELDGWILGEWGTHKDRWFWEYTYLPVGMRVTTYPSIETKAAALEHLEKLHREGPDEMTRRTIEKYNIPRLPGFAGGTSMRNDTAYERETKEAEHDAYQAGRDHAVDVTNADGCNVELFGSYEIAHFGIADFDADTASALNELTEAWEAEVRAAGAFDLGERQYLGRKVAELHRRTWQAFVKGYNEQLLAICPDAREAGAEDDDDGGLDGISEGRVISTSQSVPSLFEIGQALRRIDRDRLWIVMVSVSGDYEGTSHHHVLVEADTPTAARNVALERIESKYSSDWRVQAGRPHLAADGLSDRGVEAAKGLRGASGAGLNGFERLQRFFGFKG